MKKIVEYQCEICNRLYPKEKDAVECESRGLFDHSKFMVGLMYPYYHNGFIGIFALANIHQSTWSKHFADYSSWASRTARYPAGVLNGSLGNLVSNSAVLPSIAEWIGRFHITGEHLKVPEFEKMVYALKANGITPRYYNKDGQLIEIT